MHACRAGIKALACGDGEDWVWLLHCKLDLFAPAFGWTFSMTAVA
jgi:hypothetical protein